MLSRPAERVHRLPARPRRADALFAGEVIVRQGDPADAFYLVRLGFVKVTEAHPGGELVLAYIPRGGYFGEIGLARRRRAHGDLHRARPRRGCPDLRRRFPQDGRDIPRDPRGVRACRRRARWRRTASRQKTTDSTELNDFLAPGADGGAEPARPRPREVHALR